MKRRQFTNEFKAEAVRLVRGQGVKASVAARDLGIPETTLYNWGSSRIQVGKKQHFFIIPVAYKQGL